MKIIDIVKTPNLFDLKKFSEIINWIDKHEVHRNKENYLNLLEEYKDYDSFELLYDVDDIVAFSGLYNNGRYSNAARSCTRTYYVHKYRCKGLTRPRWSEEYFIPYETTIAENQKYDYVFISIELLMRRRSMIDLVDNLNDWILHPNMCNTCPTSEKIIQDIKCWQNVCYKKLTNTTQELDLPTISFNEYGKMFGDNQILRIKRLM